MKIINLLPNAQPYDLPKQQAEGMIAAGIAKAYVAPARKFNPNAKFGLNRYNYDGQPYIIASCSSCGNSTHMYGPTAHTTQSFRHCGVTESIPKDIAAEYERARGQWKPKPEAPARTPMTGFVIPI